MKPQPRVNIFSKIEVTPTPFTWGTRRTSNAPRQRRGMGTAARRGYALLTLQVNTIFCKGSFPWITLSLCRTRARGSSHITSGLLPERNLQHCFCRRNFPFSIQWRVRCLQPSKGDFLRYPNSDDRPIWHHRHKRWRQGICRRYELGDQCGDLWRGAKHQQQSFVL